MYDDQYQQYSILQQQLAARYISINVYLCAKLILHISDTLLYVFCSCFGVGAFNTHYDAESSIDDTILKMCMFVAKTSIIFAVTITYAKCTPILRDTLVDVCIYIIYSGCWHFWIDRCWCLKYLVTYCGNKNTKNNYVGWVVAQHQLQIL